MSTDPETRIRGLQLPLPCRCPTPTRRRARPPCPTRPPAAGRRRSVGRPAGRRAQLAARRAHPPGRHQGHRRGPGPPAGRPGTRRLTGRRLRFGACRPWPSGSGPPPTARFLILNCADLGLCHAATTGVYDALREGLATSASLLVPAPWAREAASRFRGDDVGVRLTLNAEHDLYRWGPITQAPSLLDGDGGFPRTVTDVWDHADLDEVRRECRAQVERAVLWGFDISHLDAHMDALVLRPEFFDIYLELADRLRTPPPTARRRRRAPRRASPSAAWRPRKACCSPTGR